MTTQKFEFVDYNVDLDIAGQSFTMDCSSETGDYLKGVAAELRSLAAALANGEKTVDDAVNYGTDVIDHLLGDGAADRIFAARKKRMSDIADLCMWLTEVATKFQKERARISGNRAERRAAAKNKG